MATETGLVEQRDKKRLSCKRIKSRLQIKDLQTYILAVAFQANNPSADTKPYKKPPIVDILRKERQMS
jgi:hypothetical protein